MKEFAVYTLARVGLFLATYALVIGVYLVLSGTRTFPVTLWPLLLAAVISALASYKLLAVPRQRFAAKVEERAQAAARKFEGSRSKEDVD